MQINSAARSVATASDVDPKLFAMDLDPTFPGVLDPDPDRLLKSSGSGFGPNLNIYR
jgi:hypothetical protein